MGSLKLILYVTGCLILLLSLIPLIRHDNWTFRIFEFPRFQKFILNTLILIAFLPLLNFKDLSDLFFLSLLFTNSTYLGMYILPYTPFSTKQLKSATQYEKETGDPIWLLFANVYQDNRNADQLLKIITEQDPDLLLLIETDEWWKEALNELNDEYRDKILYPKDNTYGILFYSKFKLKDPEVKFLVENDKPSIHVKVILSSGKMVQFYGIHPAPPNPQYKTHTVDRDKELLKVGKMAKNQSLPVIVSGDLNDVAWSYTTDLFMKYSKLLDPRRGRGMFNTYHAKYPFLRWPLDHVFCSSHFKLINLKRLTSFGSDHFPLLISLLLKDEKQYENELPDTDMDDRKTAREKLHKEKQGL